VSTIHSATIDLPLITRSRAPKLVTIARSALSQPPGADASLLGLPTELRFQIFDIIINTDLDHKIVRGRSRLSPEDKALRPPLANLARTSKLLATEIRRHRATLPTNNRYATISLRTSTPLDELDLSKAEMRLTRIPYPTAYLCVLNLEYNFTITERFSTGDVPSFFLPLSFTLAHFIEGPLDLHVYCCAKRDKSSIDEQVYEEKVQELREALESERERYLRLVKPESPWPKVVRIVEFSC
jgi:hypothetical protein